LKPLSKPLPHRERGFDSYSPSLVGKGLGVRFERKLHTALINLLIGDNGDSSLCAISNFTDIKVGIVKFGDDVLY
jgi:hypothetical protein